MGGKNSKKKTKEDEALLLPAEKGKHSSSSSSESEDDRPVADKASKTAKSKKKKKTKEKPGAYTGNRKVASAQVCQEQVTYLKIILLFICLILCWIVFVSRSWVVSMPSSVVLAVAQVGDIKVPHDSEIVMESHASRPEHLDMYAGLWDLCISNVRQTSWFSGTLARLHMKELLGECTAYLHLPPVAASKLFGSTNLTYTAAIFYFIAVILIIVDIVLSFCVLKYKDKRTPVFLYATCALTWLIALMLLISLICAQFFFSPGESLFRKLGLLLKWSSAFFIAIAATVLIFIAAILGTFFMLFEKSIVEKSALLSSEEKTKHKLLLESVRVECPHHHYHDDVRGVGAANRMAGRRSTSMSSISTAVRKNHHRSTTRNNRYRSDNHAPVLVHQISQNNIAAPPPQHIAQPLRRMSSTSSTSSGSSFASHHSHPAWPPHVHHSQPVYTVPAHHTMSAAHPRPATSPLAASHPHMHYPGAPLTEVEEVVTFKVPEGYNIDLLGDRSSPPTAPGRPQHNRVDTQVLTNPGDSYVMMPSTSPQGLNNSLWTTDSFPPPRGGGAERPPSTESLTVGPPPPVPRPRPAAGTPPQEVRGVEFSVSKI